MVSPMRDRAAIANDDASVRFCTVACEKTWLATIVQALTTATTRLRMQRPNAAPATGTLRIPDSFNMSSKKP